MRTDPRAQGWSDALMAVPGGVPHRCDCLHRHRQSLLAAFDPRKSEILELHYFGGLTYEELADFTGLSTTTLNLELRLAKAWLKHALSG